MFLNSKFLDFTDLLKKSLNANIPSKSIRSQTKPAVCSGFILLNLFTTILIASSQVVSTNLPLVLTYGLSNLCFSNPSHAYLVLSEIHSSFIFSFTFGRILFTSKAPKIVEDERVEFILQDSGGNEKSLSLRILNIDKREIPEIIKLSIGNTPKDVKRGETIIINGEATPNSTITVTSKLPDGNVLNTNTILVGTDGKWSYEKIFTPNLDLGNISIEIDGFFIVL